MSEKLLEEIRDELRISTSVLKRMLNELEAYVAFRKRQGK